MANRFYGGPSAAERDGTSSYPRVRRSARSHWWPLCFCERSRSPPRYGSGSRGFWIRRSRAACAPSQHGFGDAKSIRR